MKLVAAGSLSLVLIALAAPPCGAAVSKYDASIFFSCDANAAPPMTRVKEGDSIWVCVYEYAVCSICGPEAPCCMVGAGGTALASRRQGLTWKSAKTGTTADLQAVCPIGDETSSYWAVSDEAATLRILPSERDWKAELVSQPDLCTLRVVPAADEPRTAAASEGSAVAQWDPSNSMQGVCVTQMNLTAVCLADRNDIWALGVSATVIHCANAIQDWDFVPLGKPNLTIAPGRICVDGILCECEEAARYEVQRGCVPEAAATLADEQPRTDLVYLDVWDRHIEALEDPSLREPALGGPDTSTRVKTVWQLKVYGGVTPSRAEARQTALDQLAMTLMSLSLRVHPEASSSACPRHCMPCWKGAGQLEPQ